MGSLRAELGPRPCPWVPAQVCARPRWAQRGSAGSPMALLSRLIPDAVTRPYSEGWHPGGSPLQMRVPAQTDPFPRTVCGLRTAPLPVCFHLRPWRCRPGASRMGPEPVRTSGPGTAESRAWRTLTDAARLVQAEPSGPGIHPPPLRDRGPEGRDGTNEGSPGGRSQLPAAAPAPGHAMPAVGMGHLGTLGLALWPLSLPFTYLLSYFYSPRWFGSVDRSSA